MEAIKPNDIFEIQIEYINGETVTIKGKAMPKYMGNSIIVGDCHNFYSYEEADRKGVPFSELPWMLLPYGDLEFELSGGFVTLRRGTEIVFMEMRDRIKKSVTLVNGEELGS